MRRIIISGPPPVQVLDVTGPLEVFSNVPDYQVEIVASNGLDQLITNRGITVGGAVPRDSIPFQINWVSPTTRMSWRQF